jgi:hypothetical protein
LNIAVKDTQSAKMGRIAVAQVQLAVVSELGWLFRQQHNDDYGIDAHVEFIDDSTVTAKLLALQIKGGRHWFRESGPGGWWYRPDVAHVRYWTSHSLPVIVVLYNPSTRSSYWQIVNNRNLRETSSGGWKILVPEANRLDKNAAAALADLAAGDPYVLRLRELQLARPLMTMLAEGHRMVIEIEEWVTRTTGRGSITLALYHEVPGYTTPLVTWGVLLGSSGYAEAVPRLFAWANVEVHGDTYDEATPRLYEAECGGAYDEDDPVVVEEYADWRARRLNRTTLRPFVHANQEEVAYWMLELTLNDLGRGFLLVDEFAIKGGRQLTLPGRM